MHNPVVVVFTASDPSTPCGGHRAASSDRSDGTTRTRDRLVAVGTVS